MATLELAVSEELRPRVARALGVPLAWDVAVDSLPLPAMDGAAGLLVAACRLYRRIRPRRIGDRCAFEPSCSRYAELCFRSHGAWSGLKLTAARIHRCKACNGGLDLPPHFEESWVLGLEEAICSIV